MFDVGRWAFSPAVSLNYESAGVRYEELDAFKRACQRAAHTTTDALSSHGYTEPASTRGESAYLLEGADHFLAHVEEGLGTKNLVADEMQRATGRCFYRALGIDTVATIVNDLITCGAVPISVAMHAAVGDSSWFKDTARAAQLVSGFAEGCRLAGAVWGGGETPTLGGVVVADAIVLAGSAVGKISPKAQRIVGDVRAGDAIVFLASSGVQTNGLSLCRQVAEQLPQGYLTPIGSAGSPMFGEALLEPSVIYVNFVRECQRRGIKLNYVAHVTGHGWRKLMRLDDPFVYEITTPRNPPPLFAFLERAGPVEKREMFATFNQGVGFAAMVSPEHLPRALAAAADTGYDAWHAGVVRRDGQRKAVEIPSLGIDFSGETLNVR